MIRITLDRTMAMDIPSTMSLIMKELIHTMIHTIDLTIVIGDWNRHFGLLKLNYYQLLLLNCFTWLK